jgi:hypothetical protein
VDVAIAPPEPMPTVSLCCVAPVVSGDVAAGAAGASVFAVGLAFVLAALPVWIDGADGAVAACSCACTGYTAPMRASATADAIGVLRSFMNLPLDWMSPSGRDRLSRRITASTRSAFRGLVNASILPAPANTIPISRFLLPCAPIGVARTALSALRADPGALAARLPAPQLVC